MILLIASFANSTAMLGRVRHSHTSPDRLSLLTTSTFRYALSPRSWALTIALGVEIVRLDRLMRLIADEGDNHAMKCQTE